MYQSYWKLARRPFECGADSSRYYPSEAHQAALLKLRYAVENRRGAALLAGAPGTGKTMLVQLLARQLAPPFGPVAHIVYPAMEAPQLLTLVADQLGATTSQSTGGVENSVRRISGRLGELSRQGRRPLVVIDEAHLVTPTRSLDAVRLLLNFETSAGHGITLVLVGQSTLVSAVQRNPQLEERIAVKCLLRPLNLRETIGYVRHHLKSAGAADPVFEPAALGAIFQLTRGIPRRINRLCDLALLVGFAEEQPQISRDLLESVSQDLAPAAAA